MAELSSLTVDFVKSLAPDARSFGDAKKLATATSWRRLGRDAGALWGVALGSSGEPYAVFARSTEAMYCSCPSRKSPCKHRLALLLLAADGHAFVEEALPSGHRYSDP